LTFFFLFPPTGQRRRDLRGCRIRVQLPLVLFALLCQSDSPSDRRRWWCSQQRGGGCARTNARTNSPVAAVNVYFGVPNWARWLLVTLLDRKRHIFPFPPLCSGEYNVLGCFLSSPSFLCLRERNEEREAFRSYHTSWSMSEQESKRTRAKRKGKKRGGTSSMHKLVREENICLCNLVGVW